MNTSKSNKDNKPSLRQKLTNLIKNNGILGVGTITGAGLGGFIHNKVSRREFDNDIDLYNKKNKYTAKPINIDYTDDDAFRKSVQDMFDNATIPYKNSKGGTSSASIKAIKYGSKKANRRLLRRMGVAGLAGLAATDLGRYAYRRYKNRDNK